MIKYVDLRIISGRDIRLRSLQFLQSFGGTENPHYFCAAKQKSIMKQTPLYNLQSAGTGIVCWMPQPMVSSDALTERTHRITEDLD